MPFPLPLGAEHFIVKIKNYPMEIKQKVYQAKRISWIGIVVNTLLSFVKFIVGYLGNSQTVIADAIHSLSDLATDFIVLAGVKYWNAPPDDTHPYGHRRIETLISVTIGIFLAFVAFALIYKALISFNGEYTKKIVTLTAVIGPILSIIAKEILYRATLDVGKRINSNAIIANAFHHRSDVLSSFPALISVCLSTISQKLTYFDNLGSILVSCFILKSAWDIIKPAIIELSDGANAEENDLIRQEVIKVEGVCEVHGIRTRTHGGCTLLDLHILVDPDITVQDGHEISEKVKEALLSKNNKIIDVVVHLEPFEKTDKIYLSLE